MKYENQQFTGSFKERGARNYLAHLSTADRAVGVVAASAGNHAQGVAYHARLLGIAATIVMPAETPFTKVANTAHHGAQIVLEGADYTAAFAHAQRLAAETGAHLVPAFDDPLIIAGQGTIGLEILDAVPALDAIVVPVGGGGLIAGIAVAVKALAPNVRVVGVQSEGYAGMLHALGRAPAPTGGSTVAEGIAVTEPGVLTRAIVGELVDEILVASEQQIEAAMALFVEIEKAVVEGAGAAALAAVHRASRAVPRPTGRARRERRQRRRAGAGVGACCARSRGPGGWCGCRSTSPTGRACSPPSRPSSRASTATSSTSSTGATCRASRSRTRGSTSRSRPATARTRA